MNNIKTVDEVFEAPQVQFEGASKVFTIYCHTHTDSGRRYIGLTKRTLMQRWKDHVYAAKSSKNGRWHFPNAIRLYGKDAFSHEVLETCSTLEAANAAEERWIEHYKTRDPQFGFNLAKGGEHIPHPIRRNPWDRPEFREKGLGYLAKANAEMTPEIRSERAKEFWQRPEYKEKVFSTNKRTWSDPEMRAKMSEMNKQIKADPDVKKKASEFSKRMWESDEYRADNAKLWEDPEFRTRCQSGLVHGSSINKNKTHCSRGHEYSEENTYVNKRGSRECRTCLRIRNRNSTRIRKGKLKSLNI